jgi:hypothetical protein
MVSTHPPEASPPAQNDPFEGLDETQRNLDRTLADHAHLLTQNQAIVALYKTAIAPAIRRAISVAHELAATDSSSNTSLFYPAESITLPPHVPRLGLTVAPVILNSQTGRRAYIRGSELDWAHDSFAGPLLAQNTSDYTYEALKLTLPVLIDPILYTPEEYTDLPEEHADEFAARVVDTIPTTQPYDIIRALGVLPAAIPPSPSEPLLPDFAYAPNLSSALIDRNRRRTYAIKLLQQGSTITRGAPLTFDSYIGQQHDNYHILAITDDKQVAFRSNQSPATRKNDVPNILAPHSQDALAMYLTPYLDESQSYLKGYVYPPDRSDSDLHESAAHDPGTPPTIYVLRLLTI